MIYKQPKGFSMVEMIVVMVILAILGSVAYPSYIKSQRETRRNDAYSGLFEIKSIIDNYLAINETANYSGWNAATANTTIKYNTRSKGKYYTLTISNFSTGPFSYTIRATAVGTQTSDSGCTVIFLDSNNTKTPITCW
jgi:type IV pilus assembly protein PilE